jgi:uncharacterized SAM-binding protein YcdF (DUF218 family)
VNSLTLKRPNKRMRWRRIIFGALLIPPLWLLSLAIEIYTYSSATYPSLEDGVPAVAIVLGAEVWDEHPSPVFEERIKHGVRLYEAGQVSAIIFTGGVGEGDQSAESEVAKGYAIQLGVPAEDIYCETRSKITYENLEEAKKILDRQNLETALIVSDPLHMKRAVTIARDLDIDAYPSPTPTSRYETWRSKWEFLLRETYFYAAYLLRRLFL